MRRFPVSIVLAGLALFAATVARSNTPDWRDASASDSAVYEVDAANIRVRDGKLTAWVRMTHSTEQVVGRAAYSSQVSLYVFNCSSESSGMVNVAAYAGPRGTGRLVVSGNVAAVAEVEMQYLPPSSVFYGVLEFVCARAPRRSGS